MKTHHKINTVILAATVVILLASITTLADNIYVSSGTSIIKIDSSGNKSTFASGPGVSLGLAFDRSGNLYASYEDTGTILKFDSSGNGTLFASGLNQPLWIATQVPEPTTLLLLGFGAAIVRRKRS